jgi:hypothetical protein
MANDYEHATISVAAPGHGAEVLFHFKTPLAIRLFLLPFALGMLYAATMVFGLEAGLIQRPAGVERQPWWALLWVLLVTVLFCWMSLGTWIWEIWLLLDPENGTLVHRHRGILLSIHHSYPIQDIASLRATLRRGTRGSRYLDLEVILNDGTTKYVIFHHGYRPEPARALAASIAGRIGVPLAIVDKT